MKNSREYSNQQPTYKLSLLFMTGMDCTICGQEAAWVENKAVYGRNYGKSYMIWLCPNRHYVGCHNNTKTPKGTFADQETRLARRKAHAVIDPLWQNGKRSRGFVYEALSKHFGRQIHMGEASKEECEEIARIAKLLFKEIRHSPTTDTSNPI